MNTTKYFNLAKNASSFSDYPRVHIGAILVYKNKVIANGCNTTKTNPIQYKYNHYREQDNDRGYDVDSHLPTIHAEIKCLIDTKDIDIDWSKVFIFVYRQLRNGQIGLSRPCSACYQALKDRGIKHLYYTTENGYNYEIIK